MGMLKLAPDRADVRAFTISDVYSSSNFYKDQTPNRCRCHPAKGKVAQVPKSKCDPHRCRERPGARVRQDCIFTGESRPRGGFIPTETLVLAGTAGDNGTASRTINQPVLAFLVLEIAMNRRIREYWLSLSGSYQGPEWLLWSWYRFMLQTHGYLVSELVFVVNAQCEVPSKTLPLSPGFTFLECALAVT